MESGDGIGYGTSTSPLRIANASEFDDIFKKYRDDTRFILHPGTYYTRGAWAFDGLDYCNLGAGCELIGAGSKVTEIRLAADFEDTVGGQPATYIETFIAGSRSGASAYVRVEGVSFVCDCGLPSSGLHTYSTSAQIKDVAVRGIGGDWNTMIEAFGILCNKAPLSPVHGNCRIDGCEVSSEGGNYATCIYLGITSSTGVIMGSAIVDCVVTSPEAAGAPKQTHAAYSANEKTVIQGCRSSGTDRFFFCDTGPVRDVQIIGCQAEFRYCCVDAPAPSAGFDRARIQISDCIFRTVNPTTNHSILVLLQDKSEETGGAPVYLGDVIVRDCIWTAAAVTPPATLDLYAVSIKGTQTEDIKIRGCILPDGCFTTQGVYPPTPAGEVLFEA
jgi:hypothetical protein